MFIFLGIVVGLVVIVALMYNRLVTLRNRVRNSWAQVDVVLKNRFDLIPNLLETVSGYTKYEKDTLNQLTQLRTRFASAASVQDKAATTGELSGVLNRLLAVSENYPELKANENFLYLKQQLSELEDKIRFARQFYNDSVEMFNTSVMSFPSNLIAKVFGFREEDYFQVDEADKALPRITF